MEKVTCLHCHEENISSEKHTCIWEALDLLAHQIVSLKEDKCGNSGLNWNDHYHEVKSRLLAPTEK